MAFNIGKLRLNFEHCAKGVALLSLCCLPKDDLGHGSLLHHVHPCVVTLVRQTYALIS
ncbi:hypothetical protein [Microvirga tunisiensis]|jgi:hypothetical protein|uniref:hypothetical protein n=1 Tax=Microvirga tunisiensis TaxID=2108360 RepID=UPI00129C8DB0|nr:hypothetical protein [Microvirga tunisiensis]